MKCVNRFALLAALLLVAISALAQDVHYNYDHAANFQAYRTYQWVDIPGAKVPDQLVDQAIKRAIEEQLAQKGLTKVEKGADLYIGYQAVINLEKSVNLWGTGTGFDGFDGWGSRNVQGQTSTIPVGILVIDMYDPAHKQLIWRGDATKTLDLNKDPDKNYKKLQKAMTKLFKNYPPSHK